MRRSSAPCRSPDTRRARASAAWEARLQKSARHTDLAVPRPRTRFSHRHRPHASTATAKLHHRPRDGQDGLAPSRCRRRSKHGRTIASIPAAARKRPTLAVVHRSRAGRRAGGWPAPPLRVAVEAGDRLTIRCGPARTPRCAVRPLPVRQRRARRQREVDFRAMGLANRRRETEVFSLAFLDCICCGFGAVIRWCSFCRSCAETHHRQGKTWMRVPRSRKARWRAR